MSDDLSAPQGTPDGTGESRAKAAVTKIPVDPALKEAARERICDAVRGNKFDPAQVSIHAFEGELLRFTAETVLELRTKNANKTIGGRASAPIAVDNENALKDAIHKEYRKVIESRDMVRKIREVVLNRKEKGFAEDDIVIPLNFWKRDFVIHEACGSCRGSGKITCQRCKGVGLEICPQCKRKGEVPCGQCRGARWVPGAGGKNVTCPSCAGKGEQGCPLCNRRGEVQCRVCKTKKATQCTNCQGHGWISHIHMVTLDIRTKFLYDRNVVPDKVAELMDRLGPRLDEHAKIEVSQWQEHEDEKVTEEKIAIHYNVELPYGHIEFALGKETFYAFLFGTQARLTYVSPFLDKIIANGARKLKDAADSRGNVKSNLLKAAEYETVRRALLLTSRHSKAKAAKSLQAATPLGLSRDMIKVLITDSGRALKNITRAARGTAFGIGLFSGAGISWLYYFYPLRPKIMELIGPDPWLHAGADVVLVALCAALCAAFVKIADRTAQASALKEIVTIDKREAFLEAERKAKQAAEKTA